MTKADIATLAKIQIEIARAIDRTTSAELIAIMERHLAAIDGIVAKEVNRIIPDLASGWGPGYSLLYLTEKYIRRIAELQIGILQSTELQHPETMALAQKNYFEYIDEIIRIEVGKAVTMNIKFSNIKQNKN